MRRYLKTNAVRLAALYFTLFATSVLALLVFIYLSTADFATRQTEATLDAEARGLAEQYQERGLAGLVEIIQDRSTAGRGERTLYLIADPMKHRLAGNLSIWPNARLLRPGWIEFAVEENSNGVVAQHTALASVFVLRGGYQLLVGRDLRDAAAFRGRITQTLAWSALLTLALGIVGGVLMTRNMSRRGGEPHQRPDHPWRPVAARAGVGRRRRVRSARRQPQRHARPDRAADDGHAASHRQHRA